MTFSALAAGCSLLLFLAGCGGGGGGTSSSSPTPPPAGNVPQNVTAAARAGSITVSWSPVAGATSYNVYWSASPNVTKQNGNPVSSVTSPYVQAGLTGGTTRYYVATCIVGGAEGPDSAVATATIPVSLVAGPDVGQYFDRGFQAAGAQNYDDRSSHPLQGLTTPDNTLLFGGENCLDCHYVSGPARTSDECLKCHFENQPNAPAGNHRNGIIELATITGNGLPTADNLVNTLQGYDNWCLQCHGSESGITLGGISPRISRRTVLDPAAFANGKHRRQNPPVGCIYCHHPHGRSNTMLVRENPGNRGSAPGSPTRFGVYPSDNTGSYTGSFFTFSNQNQPYRSRPYWADNTQPYLPEADDDQAYCNKACHIAKFSNNDVKDKMIKRDGTTGNYIITPGNRKIYLINGGEYTVDNISTFFSRPHVHTNGDIITTDDMVEWLKAFGGLNVAYKYPGAADSNPGNFNIAASSLPFRPDYQDGVRDFMNGYLNLGPIRYRFTCSTCHDPHGTTLQNQSSSDPGYPDLRLMKSSPNTNNRNPLCNECHR
jgi:hypothetical protein